MRWIGLANPEGKRIAFFQEALAALGQPPARVVSWLDFLAEPEVLAAALAGEGGPTSLRIESTGKSFAVERELIALGADAELGDAERIDAAGARALAEDKGRVRFLRQRHEGFLVALTRIEAILAAQPEVQVMSPPSAIRLMFDKPRCHAACEAAGVPVPPALPGPIGSYAALREAMAAASLPRVFVKASHASSASGVIALATHPKDPRKVVATTTVELVRQEGQLLLYNSRKIRRYTREADVAAIVDALCREGVQVEAWLPKLRLGGKSSDLRCVVIGGRASHVVVRTSESPLTNLHLLNPRGDLEACQAQVGPEAWQRAMEACEAACAAVGAPLYAGVDLCMTRKGERAVLEVNAFGDLLPRVLVDGRDTYQAEVAAALAAA
ncbi:MAG TPA: hypothetical protein DEA08_35795 [Planctomycetes bacterium]|nr:hypothetical protein [Planctomycetota bacterium]